MFYCFIISSKLNLNHSLYHNFRFDALSHRSSGSSLNVANNLGTVSKTSTPLSGSLENLGGGELLRKAFNTSTTGQSQPSIT